MFKYFIFKIKYIIKMSSRKSPSKPRLSRQSAVRGASRSPTRTSTRSPTRPRLSRQSAVRGASRSPTRTSTRSPTRPTLSRQGAIIVSRSPSRSPVRSASPRIPTRPTLSRQGAIMGSRSPVRSPVRSASPKTPTRPTLSRQGAIMTSRSPVRTSPSLSSLSPFTATPNRPAQLTRQGAILESPLFSRRNVSFQPEQSRPSRLVRSGAMSGSAAQRSFFDTLYDQAEDNYSTMDYTDYSDGDIY